MGTRWKGGAGNVWPVTWTRTRNGRGKAGQKRPQRPRSRTEGWEDRGGRGDHRGEETLFAEGSVVNAVLRGVLKEHPVYECLVLLPDAVDPGDGLSIAARGRGEGGAGG